MAIQPFRKIRANDPVVEQLQRAVEDPLKDISSRLILDGQLLRDVVLTSGSDTVIDHKLQRNLVGWLVVRSNAAATYYDKQATNLTPDLTLVLRTSATATVTLWVF